MIVVKLVWGLGNQLSQYAMGRHIALKNNTELLLDRTSFDTYNLHKYSLQHFQIVENFASKKEIPWYEIRLSNKYLDYILNRLKPFLRIKWHILEKGQSFNEQFLRLQWRDFYLEWYWQSEKYFSEIESTIRNDLQIKTPPSSQNIKMIDTITWKNSVSIHIRRGDYVNNKKANQVHGTCDMDYYMRAVEYIAKNSSAPQFFVFSDDISWAMEHLRLWFPTTYVDHNDALTNYEDLRLMSLCSHNIIANSTFSWWGAWLNKNPKKIVIAPKRWFNTSKHNADDIVPISWIRL